MVHNERGLRDRDMKYSSAEIVKLKLIYIRNISVYEHINSLEYSHQLPLSILDIQFGSVAVAYVGFLCITIDSSFCDAHILAVVVDERLAIIPLVVPYAGLAAMSLVVQCVPLLLKLLLSFILSKLSIEGIISVFK